MAVTGLHRRHGPVHAVAGVDLRVDAGEVVALLGPNGAGKTTLSNCVIGLLEPHAGARSSSSVVTRAAPRPVDSWAWSSRTSAFPRPCGSARSSTVPRRAPVVTALFAAASLTEVGLADLEASPRRAPVRRPATSAPASAMALVADPRLLVLDEPTEGLDVTALREFWRTLADRRDQGAGVLLTTHAVAEAAEVADRVVVLQAGRVVAEGAPDQLTARVADRHVRARTSLDPAVVGAWPGVRSATARSGLLDLVADHTEDTVRRLLAADPGLSDLTITRATLADAVASLGPDTLEDVA